MYVISMLCMLKIYQTRHPDINAEAHAAFSVLAIVVLLGVVAVLEDSLAFRIIFAVIHLLTCLALSIRIYYMGLCKLGKFHFIQLLLQWNFDILGQQIPPSSSGSTWDAVTDFGRDLQIGLLRTRIGWYY
jgi:hypothetical protein